MSDKEGKGESLVKREARGIEKRRTDLIRRGLESLEKKPVQKAQVEITRETFTESLPDGVNLEMVSIPGGSFMMGSNTFEDTQPIHKVTIKPFYIGKYQVTQAQWKAVMNGNPSGFTGDSLPVETVSWYDTQEFCKELSRITGREYRLPSEAEWEYAARAGSKSDYCFDDDEISLGEYAWYEQNSDGKTHPVGMRKPNYWGLYDVQGNVWEWCADIWHDNYEGAPIDGSSWIKGGKGDSRPIRGGSWGDFMEKHKCAVSRYEYYAYLRASLVGFRVVSSASPFSVA